MKDETSLKIAYCQARVLTQVLEVCGLQCYQLGNRDAQSGWGKFQLIKINQGLLNQELT